MKRRTPQITWDKRINLVDIDVQKIRLLLHDLPNLRFNLTNNGLYYFVRQTAEFVQLSAVELDRRHERRN